MHGTSCCDYPLVPSNLWRIQDYWTFFGVARCTVYVIIHDTCKVIVDVLLKTYIQFPQGDKLSLVFKRFKNKWGMIQCAGSIDGCHIPVTPLASNHTDYYNRKGWYSMLVQAVVDHDYLITDICVSWPGSVHDANVLVKSTLYRRACQREILCGQNITVNGTAFPVFLVGDSAYNNNSP